MGDIGRNIKVYITLTIILIVCVFVAVLVRVLTLQLDKGKFKDLENGRIYRMNTIRTQAGNMYAVDGTTGELLLLASDQVRYDVYMDLGQGRISAVGEKEKKGWVITDTAFKKNIDGFCSYLSSNYGKRTPSQWKQYLQKNRQPKSRYVLLLKQITQSELDNLKRQPLCKGGRGIITNPSFKRVYPYGDLARRTIGIEFKDDKGETKYDGIDGYYGPVIKGECIKREEFKAGKNLWIPVEDTMRIRPKRSKDIISTIDVSLQELAQEGLKKCLDSNQAQNGTVILMETKTGYIKAIASYTRRAEHEYYEDLNIAVGAIFEPGSTFKTVTVMMLLDKGYADTSDQVPIGMKEFVGSNKPIKDVNKNGYAGDVSLARAIEISSNVGISAEVYNHYGQTVHTREQFAKDLQQYFPYQKLNSDIAIYEPQPYIRSSKRVDDLLRMSFGYVTAMTPLQMLTFYNGIANDGKIMKPLFVQAIMQDGHIIETKQPVVLKEQMCKEQTLKQVQTMLRNVVLYGTGRRLRSVTYGIAGKSGTAEINYTGKVDSKYRKHRASFAGYFPADNPQYSCIVVISEPQKGLTHGGDLAAPVFRELSDRVMGVNARDTKVIAKSNTLDKGAKKTKNQYHNMKAKVDYAINQGVVPDVRGWNIADAVYCLEKLGLQVSFKGYGPVISQSLKPKTKIKKLQKIELKLEYE